MATRDGRETAAGTNGGFRQVARWNTGAILAIAVALAAGAGVLAAPGARDPLAAPAVMQDGRQPVPNSAQDREDAADDAETPADDPLAILDRLVGAWAGRGLWEDPTRGGMRVEYERVLEGKLFRGRSFTVEGQGAARVERQVYDTVIHYHPGDKQLVFRSVSAGGALYDGTLTASGDNAIEFTWTDYSPGVTRRWRQTLRFVDADTYEWEVFAAADDGWRPAFRSTFHRLRDTALAADERRLQFETIVAGDPDSTWRRWATEEGVTSFFAPAAKIELRPGGAYEMHFDPSAEEGSRGSEGCRIIAASPGRLLAFEWNAPPSMPNVRKERTHVTLTFEPVGRGWTRVQFSQHGWGEGEEWDRTHDYFARIWPHVLSKLKATCAAALSPDDRSATAGAWALDEGVLLRLADDPTRIEAEIVIAADAPAVWRALRTGVADANVASELPPSLLAVSPTGDGRAWTCTLTPIDGGMTLVQRVDDLGEGAPTDEELHRLAASIGSELRNVRSRAAPAD